MRQEDTERWLEGLKVTFEYVDELDLARIDPKASMRNQARKVPLDDEAVERYTAAMKNGDVFPPILVRPKGDRYVVVGGNHRYSAARAARAPLSAYVVDVVDEAAIALSYEDNRRHGVLPSAEERTQHAQHLVALGLTVSEAARTVGVTNNMLSRAIAADEFTRRIGRLGIELLKDQIAPTSQSRLMAISSDPVFVDAVHLVADARFAADDVYRIVTDLNTTTSEAAAHQLLANERVVAGDRIQRIAIGAGSKKDTPRVALLRLLASLDQVDKYAVADSTLVDQRADLRKRVRRGIDVFMQLDDALKHAGQR